MTLRSGSGRYMDPLATASGTDLATPDTQSPRMFQQSPWSGQLTVRASVFPGDSFNPALPSAEALGYSRASASRTKSRHPCRANRRRNSVNRDSNSVNQHCNPVNRYCNLVNRHCDSVNRHCNSVNQHCNCANRHCNLVNQHCNRANRRVGLAN